MNLAALLFNKPFVPPSGTARMVSPERNVQPEPSEKTSTKERIFQEIKNGPITCADLRDLFEINDNTIRKHLDDLLSKGRIVRREGWPALYVINEEKP